MENKSNGNDHKRAGSRSVFTGGKNHGEIVVPAEVGQDTVGRVLAVETAGKQSKKQREKQAGGRDGKRPSGRGRRRRPAIIHKTLPKTSIAQARNLPLIYA